jgi:hypothetical protein
MPRRFIESANSQNTVIERRQGRGGVLEPNKFPPTLFCGTHVRAHSQIKDALISLYKQPRCLYTGQLVTGFRRWDQNT